MALINLQELFVTGLLLMCVVECLNVERTPALGAIELGLRNDRTVDNSDDHLVISDNSSHVVDKEGCNEEKLRRARTGKLFSLPLSAGYEDTTFTNSSELPSWLAIHEDRLIGVPATKNIGFHQIQLQDVTNKQARCIRIQVKASNEPFTCSGQRMATGHALLSTKKLQPQGLDRVALLRRFFNEFIDGTPHVTEHDVTLDTHDDASKLKMSNAAVLKTGPVDGDDDADMVFSWRVKCGATISDIAGDRAIRRIESQLLQGGDFLTGLLWQPNIRILNYLIADHRPTGIRTRRNVVGTPAAGPAGTPGVKPTVAGTPTSAPTAVIVPSKSVVKSEATQTTHRPTTAATISPDAPAVVLELTMKQPFTEDLNDPNSQAFKDLAKRVEANMKSALPDADAVVVTGFKPGSTVAIVKAVYPAGKTPDADKVALSVEDAINSGKMDNLGVDKTKSVTATIQEPAKTKPPKAKAAKTKAPTPAPPKTAAPTTAPQTEPPKTKPPKAAETTKPPKKTTAAPKKDKEVADNKVQTQPPNEDVTTPTEFIDLTDPPVAPADKKPEIKTNIEDITLQAHQLYHACWSESKITDADTPDEFLVVTLKKEAEKGWKELGDDEKKWIHWKKGNKQICLCLLPLEAKSKSSFAIEVSDGTNTVLDTFSVSVSPVTSPFTTTFSATIVSKSSDVCDQVKLAKKVIAVTTPEDDREKVRLIKAEVAADEVTLTWSSRDLNNTCSHNEVSFSDYRSKIEGEAFKKSMKDEHSLDVTSANAVIDDDTTLCKVDMPRDAVDDEESNLTMIIIIVVVVVLFALIMALVLYYCCCRKKRKYAPQQDDTLAHKKPVIFLEEYDEKPDFVALQPVSLPNEKPPTDAAANGDAAPRGDSPETAATSSESDNEKSSLLTNTPKTAKTGSAPPPYAAH